MKNLIILLAVFTLGCTEKSEYIEAPAKYCESHYTGNKKQASSMHFQCISFDSKGMCTANIPIMDYYTLNEVSYSCKWAEYR
jgi:hypothetical protein